MLPTMLTLPSIAQGSVAHLAFIAMHQDGLVISIDQYFHNLRNDSVGRLQSQLFVWLY